MKNIAASKNSPGPSSIKDRLITLSVCALLAGLVWIAFGQTIHHDFLNYDDNEYVYENPVVRQGLSLQAIGWAFTHSYSANWHPLTTISHMLDCQLYGLRPWGHHRTNVILHALAAVLLFLALRALTTPRGAQLSTTNYQLSTSGFWPSAFVAALFAIHPLRVESVAWISERKDVLSGVFFGLTLLAYARYARSVRRSAWKYSAVILSFALGLLCKPSLVTLPFVLLLLDYWPLERWQSAKDEAVRAKREPVSTPQQLNTSTSFSGLVVEKIPLFLLSIASCIATLLAQSEALELTKRIGTAERVSNALLSYLTYLRQLIYPRHLAVLYPYPKDVAVLSQLIVALSFLALASVVVFLWRKRYPFALVGWLWFLGTLVPMIGLVQVGSQAHADRYTYLTQIGLYIAAAWGFLELLRTSRRRREIFATVALLVTTALTAWSYHETSNWRNTEALWRHALSTTTGNFVAHNNLGQALTLHKDFSEALSHFREAIRLKPDYAEAYNNLGNALLDSDQVARQNKPIDPEHIDAVPLADSVLNEAIENYQKSLKWKPNFAEAWTNLGTAVLQKGDIDQAISDYQKALEIAPELPEVNGNLGNALLEKGELTDAIARYSKAIELKPDYADAHLGISLALLRDARPAEAMEHLKQVVKLKPEYPEAYHNMGVILAQEGQIDSAITQYRRAIELNPDYAQAENNLGNALLREGKIDDAVVHLQKAVTIEPDYAEPYNDIGSAFIQKGQVDTAIDWYRKAIQLKQNYAEAHSNLGSAYFQKKDFDKAIEQYKAAVFFKPDSAPMQYNLGNALMAKGNRAEAINCYQAALRVQPNYAAAKQQLQKLGVPVSD